jgi:UDP:flavonoid glycosyltransferase YjiC (YdhE family)
MRILVTTTGFPGHVLPLMPFALAARAAGHEVCVAGPPPAAALTSELEFCAIGRPPHGEVAALLAEAAQRSPEEGHALVVAEGFGRAATRAALPDVLQLVGAWRPDVVLRESQEFAGLVAAQRHGIPGVADARARRPAGPP